jgi:hypothetical protein
LKLSLRLNARTSYRAISCVNISETVSVSIDKADVIIEGLVAREDVVGYFKVFNFFCPRGTEKSLRQMKE